MTFDEKLISKVIPMDSFQSFIYQIIGINNSDKWIELGHLDWTSVDKAIKVVPERWCYIVDKKIATIEKRLELYNELIFDEEYIERVNNNIEVYRHERGYSLLEYLSLFENFSEDEWGEIELFEHFYLNPKTSSKKIFLVDKQPTIKDYKETALESELILWCDELRKIPARIDISDFNVHCYINGKSEVGKSSLVKSIFWQIEQITNDRSGSLLLIDVEGDISKKIKRFKRAKERLIYFEPKFHGKTPVFNPLEVNDPKDAEILGQFFADSFKDLIQLDEEGMTNAMTAILSSCISVLATKGDSSLVELQRFMRKRENRDLIQLGRDSVFPPIRDYFSNEFSLGMYDLTKGSISTKIQTLLGMSDFYNVIHGNSTFNLERAIEDGSIIIFNISEGAGVQFSEVFGRLLIAYIQMLVQKRSNINKEDRSSLYLFIDEYQEIVTDKLEKLLSRGRKYNVKVFLSNQYPQRIQSKIVRDAVFSGTDVKIAGKNDANVADVIAKSFGLNGDDISGLDKYEFWIKSDSKEIFKFISDNSIDIDPTLSITKEEEKELDEYLLSKYYKDIDYTEKTDKKEHRYKPKYDD